MTASTDRIEHEPFCRPQPGEKQIRTESWPVTGDNGTTLVSRCIDCGAQHFTRLGQLG